jgi:hypothetical protein
MNPIGNMASFVYPYIFVSNKGTDTVLKHQIENLFLSQVIWTGSLFLLILVFFKDRESVSKLTEEEADTIRESLILGE